MTATYSTILDEALANWAAIQPFKFPPPDDLLLAERGTCRLVIDKGWAPPVGYWRYVHLKGHLELVDTIPEVRHWPELADALRLLNDASTMVETLGCDVASEEDRSGDAAVMVNSYTDLFFSSPELQSDPTHSIRLAVRMLQAVEGCEQWWAQVSISLQQMKKPASQNDDRWALMVAVRNHGRSKANARDLWGKTLERIVRAAAEYRLS
ncbi:MULTISPECIES: hypothetical protein [unclassified Bradyrhizobium]|uniref:hypothetical protein n=1 Tax=Bradyrhizobium sp. USDA 4541 TaxID=2817704 RepID=UPI0020A45454|nr:hypothetical protein [Bradyrhizobium sp. USDA 4541]MCP1851226.1 hypothetical protein [Bradyrhizobium sp. USDA 4541]